MQKNSHFIPDRAQHRNTCMKSICTVCVFSPNIYPFFFASFTVASVSVVVTNKKKYGMNAALMGIRFESVFLALTHTLHMYMMNIDVCVVNSTV